MLYPHALTIFESKKVAEMSTNAENVLGKLINSVWIDGGVSYFYYPNIPWFVFVNEEAILAEDGSVEDLFYSQGTCP